MSGVIEVASAEDMERCRQEGQGTERDVCPLCGAGVVSAAYYVADRGYVAVLDCRQALGPVPACSYRRVV